MKKEWYSAVDGEQIGPMTAEDLQGLIRTPEGAKLMVWREGMADWLPHEQVEEFMEEAEIASIDATESDLLATSLPPAVSSQMEIGRPIILGDCLSRAWNLTKKNYRGLIAAALVYIVLEIASSFVEGGITGLVSNNFVTLILAFVSMAFSLWIQLGSIRFGLNVVDGKPAKISQLFGEGGKLLPAIGATILYFLMVGIGLILFIVPGVYLALKFGQYMNLIVDRDLGVISSLKASSQITEGSKGSLLVLYIVSFGIVFLGILALIIGVIFVIPLLVMIMMTAYRWMAGSSERGREESVVNY